MNDDAADVSKVAANVAVETLKKIGLLALRLPMSDVDQWPVDGMSAPRCRISQEKAADAVRIAAETSGVGLKCHRMTWNLWEQAKRPIPTPHFQMIRSAWGLEPDQALALLDWVENTARYNEE